MQCPTFVANEESQRKRLMFMLSELQRICPASPVNIYSYGSRVYGTASNNSDHDFIIIVNEEKHNAQQVFHGQYNITLYSHGQFLKDLSMHKIHALECVFLPYNKIIMLNRPYSVTVNLKALRHSISEKANHSFVKAKKKIEVERDYYIGFKSLFHSLRIIKFGIQIAKHKSIVDYSEANGLWTQIIGEQKFDWEFYKTKYQPVFNQLMSDFRWVAPK